MLLALLLALGLAPAYSNVTPQTGGSLRVTGGFDVSLDAHKIERPSLLFVKVEDACHLAVDLILLPEQKR